MRVQSEDYVDAQTELHQRYVDWVAISRISSLDMDAGKLADRFESAARKAAEHSVGHSRSTGLAFAENRYQRRKFGVPDEQQFELIKNRKFVDV